MKNNIRDCFFLYMFGFTHSGKSVTARLIAQEWKKNNPKGMIYAFDPQKRFSGLVDYYIEISDEWAIELEQQQPRKSLLIIDDYRQLHCSDRTDKDFYRLLASYQEHCNDIIITAHAPALLLERASYFVTHYFMFYTQSTDKGFKDKIMNAETLQQLRDLINIEVMNNGKGIYPLFPYIIFDCINQNVELINFK